MPQLELLNSPSSGDANRKAGDAYKTISEVANELDVPQHVLRFWETHFPQVKPSRMRGSRRYYRPEDVDCLRQIKTLLYAKGFTIKGAKKFLKTGEKAEDAAPPPPPIPAVKDVATPDLKFLASELRILKTMLNGLL